MEQKPARPTDGAKTKLEVRLLARQLSRQGLAMEWLKAAAVPVAILSVLATSILGVQQFRLAQQVRVDERFEKTLGRLTSERARDRITGVSGLRLFMNDADRDLQVVAVDVLIDAVATEENLAVQAAILDVFNELEPTRANQLLLDHALERTLQRNRNLNAMAIVIAADSIWLEQRKIVAADLKLEPDSILKPLPEDLLQRLSTRAFFRYLERDEPGISSAGKALTIPMAGLSKLIVQLLGRGAKATNFREIRCEDCAFPENIRLVGADFSRAHLRGAKFSHADLTKSRFGGADLRRVTFDYVLLDGADFVDREGRLAVDQTPDRLASLRCSRLNGADLTSLPLLSYWRELPSNGEGSFGELLGRGNTVDAETKVSMRTVAVTWIGDQWAESPTGGRVVRQIKEEALPSALLLNIRIDQRASRYSELEGGRRAATAVSEDVELGAWELRRVAPSTRSQLLAELIDSEWVKLPDVMDALATIEEPATVYPRVRAEEQCEDGAPGPRTAETNPSGGGTLDLNSLLVRFFGLQARQDHRGR